MTAPTRIKHGSAHWWVLQTLRDFGAMTERELLALGTHETPDALKAVRKLQMVIMAADKLLEIQPKGRNALATSNKQRWKETPPSKAGLRTTVNAVMKDHYQGVELKPYCGRPGAMDAYSLPSRQGDRRLHYRTGEVIA
jgi:hypothetical protein